jgi:hypothetical protein
VIVRTGVVTQVKASETVCASGAVPPADGKIGCTSNWNAAPESAPKITDSPVFGAFVAAVQSDSHNEFAAPQSASISTANEP